MPHQCPPVREPDNVFSVIAPNVFCRPSHDPVWRLDSWTEGSVTTGTAPFVPPPNTRLPVKTVSVSSALSSKKVLIEQLPRPRGRRSRYQRATTSGWCPRSSSTSRLHDQTERMGTAPCAWVRSETRHLRCRCTCLGRFPPSDRQ